MLLSAACGGDQSASSYQTSTTSPNVSQAVLVFDVEEGPDNNLFEGFAVEETAPDPNAPQAEQAEQEVRPQTVVPQEPAEPAPRVTSKPVTTTTKKASTATAKPSNPVVFSNASSFFRTNQTSGNSFMNVTMNASCEKGKEYFLEASVYQDGQLLFVDNSRSKCISSIAHYRNTIIEYSSSSTYNVIYKILQDGIVVQETSAAPKIDL